MVAWVQGVSGWAALVFIAVSITAMLCLARPRWRPALPIAAPVVLGSAAIVAAWAVFAQEHGSVIPFEEILTGQIGASFSTEVLWAVLVAAVVFGAGVLGARAAFLTERALLRRPRRPRRRIAPLPAELEAMNLPAREETMTTVAETARRPWLFWALSGLSVLGEELFYRGALLMPAGWRQDTASNPLLWFGFLVVVQAGFYALNHIGFGGKSVLGKFLLGVVLGAVGWIIGVVATVVIHLVYQRWVESQFVGRTAS